MRTPTNLSTRLKLNDGHTIPVFGLGTYLLENIDGGECEQCVLNALNCGYRLFDTAMQYGNEAAVGRAIRKSRLNRQDVYVVSKLDWEQHGPETSHAIGTCLRTLDIEYIDLFMFHKPTGGKILETYDTMLEYQKKGLIKSIGVSNFGIHHLEGIRNAGRPKPAVNQIELHPWKQRPELVKYCRENGITVMGYSPLAKGKLMQDIQVENIAKFYGKTYGQILIRWSVQKGFVTIPKTNKAGRMYENSQVFDWSLSDEHMKVISQFNEYSVMRTDPKDLPWYP